MIEYIAKRSLVAGHVAGRTYTLSVEISEAVPNVVDVREDARSAAGAIEPTFERQDVYWTIDIAPFSGDQVERVREFLDSIESGETFRVWLTDRDVLPLVLKQEGEAGSEESFMRTGSAARDIFTARFTALQAAPYDITGLQPGGGAGGFEGGDSEPVDPYDPEGGDPGGGLDPGDDEEPPPSLAFTQPINCSSIPGNYRGYLNSVFGSIETPTPADIANFAEVYSYPDDDYELGSHVSASGRLLKISVHSQDHTQYPIYKNSYTSFTIADYGTFNVADALASRDVTDGNSWVPIPSAPSGAVWWFTGVAAMHATGQRLVTASDT